MAMDTKDAYKENMKKAIHILDSLSILPDEMKRKVKQLSGGQQQRVAIERCETGEKIV